MSMLRLLFIISFLTGSCRTKHQIWSTPHQREFRSGSFERSFTGTPGLSPSKAGEPFFKKIILIWFWSFFCVMIAGLNRSFIFILGCNCRLYKFIYLYNFETVLVKGIFHYTLINYIGSFFICMILQHLNDMLERQQYEVTQENAVIIKRSVFSYLLFT